MDSVVSVFPSQRQDLQTTRSWDFLGFTEQVKRSPAEGDIIISVIDSGIWPESESFNDEGFGPPPSKWRGICDDTLDFTCNNLAGNFAKGTARGGVPSARIAVYKVCWQNGNGCDDADILAAFDDAISDGVDIISISVVAQSIKGYFENSISIGAFHAMKKGILTSTSAGNAGPRLATIVNVSPWSLNVAASTIDRKFLTEVQLVTTRYISGTECKSCSASSLDKDKVKDKIVFCENINNGSETLAAGAAGTLMSGRRQYDSDNSYALSAAYLNLQDSSNIYAYMRSTSSPTATVLKSKERNDTFAPYITNFSSRGPNLTTPGVHILATWSRVSPVSGVKGDPRYTSYNIISGTSMACPHATAVAAYVKSFHPKWSPAAIKSALMTTGKMIYIFLNLDDDLRQTITMINSLLLSLLLTASCMSAEKNPEAEFAYGAGNLNPNKACRPGLVYDIDAFDYVRFLCREGYDTKLVQIITGDYRDHCSNATEGRVFDLNYPSFALSASPSESIRHVFYRTVTNVGSPTSNYSAVVSSPNGLRIEVNPNILPFKSLEEKKSFTVTVEGRIDKFMASASLIWDDGNFQVRSPIVVVVP
ncbi:Cucumisin [Morella rubra]|uniref:Cucumisin n=1 Tax=Morella rubra TaxID=262757 RepID=A0A6A1VT23_9ROSI|nr:Cucumisin [Morella rubra]